MGKGDAGKTAVAGLTEELVKILIVDTVKGLFTVDALTQQLKEAGFIVITEDRAKELVHDEMAALVDAGTLVGKDALAGFVTEDALHEILSGMEPTLGTLVPGITSAVSLPELDPEWLDGLVFRGAKHEKVKGEAGQRPKMVAKPYERPLTPADVLSFSVGEDTVTLVTADGKKHTVEI